VCVDMHTDQVWWRRGNKKGMVVAAEAAAATHVTLQLL
jgi:hypothetical protein